MRAAVSSERIVEVLDTPIDVSTPPDAVELESIRGEVEFDHVTCVYHPGRAVLEDVSFRIEPGNTIALVGATGSGKTTVANLIPRFYDVSDGSITIDNMDVRKVTARSLRAQIGIVLQDSFLFSDTVMNNIRYGRPTATDDEVLAAARLARADSFIERLPDGYATVLGDWLGLSESDVMSLGKEGVV